MKERKTRGKVKKVRKNRSKDEGQSFLLENSKLDHQRKIISTKMINDT